MLNQRMSLFKVSMIALVLFTFASVAEGQAWQAGPDLGFARHGLDVVEYNGDLYAVGGWNGSDKLEVLYAGATTWTALASMPTAQSGLAAAIVGDKIYTMGSYGPLDVCQIYDITAGTWSAGPTLPQRLYWSTAEAVGTTIYLIGGFEPGGAGALDTIYILDTVTGIWTQGASMPGSMQIPASAVFGNEIYVFGNYGRYYVYDIAGNTWTTFTGPPSGHGGASEAVTVNDKIYLMGGSPGSIYTAYKDTEIFDPATQLWTTGPDLITGRYQSAAAYIPSADRLYIVAGRDENAASMTEVEYLDVAAMEFFADTDQLPEYGGTVNFTLNAGSVNAGRSYLIFGSITGQTPGTTLPDGTNLPINWDIFTNFVIDFANTPIFNNFLGTLDGAGGSTATFDSLGPLPSGLVGVYLDFAYALPLKAPHGWFASNAVRIEIVP